MIAIPDLTLKEVLAPHGRWCASGHTAVESWSREGPGTAPSMTRFFQVSSDQNHVVNGVYCEPCLVIANAQARKIRMEMKNGTR